MNETNESTAVNETTEVLSNFNQTLVLAYPGTLSVNALSTRNFELPSVTVGGKVQSKVLETVTSLFVDSTVFKQNVQTVDFDISNVNDIQGLLLSFNIKKADGILFVDLNGVRIYADEITSANIPPISIKKSLLKDGRNTLSFSVSKPGLLFWSTNSYILENIQVIGSVSSTQALSASSTLFLTTTESTNIEKGTLRFLADCSGSARGTLSIKINGNTIFSGMPDCGVVRPLTFSPDYIYDGENSVVFSIDTGSYFIDTISLKLDYKKAVYPVYYFEIPTNVSKEISNKKAYVSLNMSFAEDGSQKSADIIVNNRYYALNQKDRTFSLNVSDSVNAGNNALRIIPKTTLEIVELRVDVLES